MARTRRALTAEPVSGAGSAHLVSKVGQIAERMAKQRVEIAAGAYLVQQSLVREALTRTELTLALHESLLARAQLQARLRGEIAERMFERAPSAPSGRRNRLVRVLERVLLRLRWPGQALLVARTGVWRGDGGRLKHLRAIAAYARRGPDPARAPQTLFDQAWYLASHTDVATVGLSPLAHYLTSGALEGRSPHPLLDAAYYRAQNAFALAACGLTPLEHFLQVGAAGGRNPHPLFDIAYYVGQAPDLAPGEDALSHYLRSGWRQGLSPHPLFDPAWYRRQTKGAAREIPPLVHYVTTGGREGLTPHPLFDPRWYLERYPDVAAADVEPLSHFVLAGADRDPSPWFDTAHYREARRDGLAPDANPLIDYLQGGAWLVAEARPGFPTAAYLAAKPGLAHDGVTPLDHWARHGAA